MESKKYDYPPVTPEMKEARLKMVEDERRWLKYNVDSVTRERAIILCMIGQMMLPDEVPGSRERVPSPEDAKQILLVMTYGDHWVLKDLQQILSYSDKVDQLIASWNGTMDLTAINRKSLELIIKRNIHFPSPKRQSRTESNAQ